MSAILHPENSPSLNMQNGQGQLVIVQTIPPAVAAIVVAAAIIACAFAIAAWQRAQSAADAARVQSDTANSREMLARERESSALAQALAREAALRSTFETTYTESRMSEYYILELDGKLMAAGFTPPSRGYGQWKKEHQK